jgi:mono/diheme cytochrome c family protein
MSNPPSRPNPPSDSGSAAADAGVLGDSVLHGLHTDALREKEEPSEGFSLVPIFFIFLFAGLIFWSGIYIVQSTGGFRADVYDPAYDVRHPPPMPAPDPMVVGKRIFQNCQSCHGSDGTGQPGIYPPLAGSPWPVGDPERAINVLIAGMNGPVTILGNNYSNTMPDIGQLLKDNEVAAVLTYVRNSFGNEKSIMDHDPVDETMVAEVRNELRGHASYAPADVLKAFPLETKAFVRPNPDAGAGNTTATGNTTAAPGSAGPGTPGASAAPGTAPATPTAGAPGSSAAAPAAGTPGAAATPAVTAPRAGG